MQVSAQGVVPLPGEVVDGFQTLLGYAAGIVFILCVAKVIFVGGRLAWDHKHGAGIESPPPQSSSQRTSVRSSPAAWPRPSPRSCWPPPKGPKPSRSEAAIPDGHRPARTDATTTAIRHEENER
ncbi:hypothetical protein [Rhodococcus rhodochrous]|uniref:hypothetical protein n=1 Tax=Rhodococcus rhodochrous TaxID=1829 RepID=UPI001D0210B8|nr:hypothetical protein [Rhodococcus rhodochrous]